MPDRMNELKHAAGRLPAAERREQILSVAATLFAQHGLTGVTIKEIADACGINQAILYRHFDSKESLYLSVVEGKITDIDSKSFLAGLDPKQSLHDLLQSLALHILSIGITHPEIHRLLLLGTLQGSAAALDLYRAWRLPFVDYLQQELERRVAEGSLRPVDPHITARSFVGMVMDCSVSCVLWPQFGCENFNPEKAVQNNVSIFLRGMQPMMES